MAEFFVTARTEFDAGHVIPGDEECKYEGHGHRWAIEVTVRGSYDVQRGKSVDSLELGRSLERSVADLRGKSINTMLPAGRATPEGLGLSILDRLLVDWPKIVEVRVWRDPRVWFSIRREPR